MKILIVEDDEETANFIAAVLAERGHEPTVAREGREGYERAIAGHARDASHGPRMRHENRIARFRTQRSMFSIAWITFPEM